MKNPNGYGTVKKLSGKRRKPWIALTPPHDVPGELEKKRTTIGTYATRAEAMTALGAWNKDPELVIINDAKEITLTQLKEEFFKSPRFKNISKQTQGCYKAAWLKLSVLGNYCVKDIRTTHFQTVIDRAVESGQSLSSLQKIKILSGLLCDYAVQNDIVNKNYASFIVLPKAENKEKVPFSDEQMKVIEKAASENFMYADLIMILCYTGWRINEFLSLTVDDYNRDDCTLKGGLKTEAGKNRIVPVSPKIKPYLENWINKGCKYIVCNFHNKKLDKISANYFRTEWYYPTLQALNLPKLPPHATRHTFASMLHKQGVDSWDIQRLMGHSSPDVTNKVYTHIDVDQLTNAVSKL